MHIIHSDRHRGHRGELQAYRGELVPCFENQERADLVLATLQLPVLFILESGYALARIGRNVAHRLCCFQRDVRQAATQPGNGPGR